MRRMRGEHGGVAAPSTWCDALSVHLSAQARFILQDHLQAFERARQRIATCDALIRRSLEPYPDRIDPLCTVPGIDESSACAGLCSGNNQSAGKKRSGKTRKGNTFLRSLLIECAHGAARTRDCQFNGYHKALTVRRGYKRATVATAHKLLRTVYYMLRNREVYRDPQTDYEKLMVKRNAPRWIRMLKKYGLDPATGSAAPPRAA